MATCGCYHGIHWAHVRICDVLTVPSRERWYFIRDESGEYTGDHFRTLAEMKRHIDATPERTPAQ
jgi:hypothetical protein